LVMKYLKRFLTILIDYFLKRDSVTEEINRQEVIARYITSKSGYSRQKDIVKPQAFMPPPNLKLSVFRIDNLSEPEIWKIGIKKVINNNIFQFLSSVFIFFLLCTSINLRIMKW